jgi:hypothetical protein
MNKDNIIIALEDLIDEFQRMREIGEHDMRTVIYKTEQLVRKIEREEL